MSEAGASSQGWCVALQGRIEGVPSTELGGKAGLQDEEPSLLWVRPIHFLFILKLKCVGGASVALFHFGTEKPS